MPPRVVPLDDAPVTHVPFWMWLGHFKGELDFDLSHHVIHPEHVDPGSIFAAACACAYLGSFDNGYLMEFGHREERLEMVARWLPEDQFETVLAVAVPQRYRELSAADLEKMVRTGVPEDRGWAASWLALCGWFHSDECTFLGVDPVDREERLQDYIREVITDEGESSRWWGRISRAGWMYKMNGPPPLGIARPCLGGIRPGWVEMTQLVPARLHASGKHFEQGELFWQPR